MSTKKTIQIKKNEAPEYNFTKGAISLMKGFETPQNFLEFLTQALYWMDLYNDKNDKNRIDFYFLKMLIAEIAIPWLKNGDDTQKLIASGLQSLQDFCGHDGYHKRLAAITQGFTIELGDVIDSDSKRKYFLMFATMYEVGDCIANYEMDLFLKREINKAA